MANSDVDGGAAPDLSAGARGYSSELRNEEWARLEPMIPPARPGGRPRKTDMRAAMNAILYLLHTGCPWALLAARRVSATLDAAS
jgi:transposase